VLDTQEIVVERNGAPRTRYCLAQLFTTLTSRCRISHFLFVPSATRWNRVLPSDNCLFVKFNPVASAVSYCSEARSIQVDKFLLEYNADQRTLSFDIAAATVNPNLDAILEFQLTAYGVSLPVYWEVRAE
jgi:hypothetical protein